jgi:cytochrome oxidase Cu insertion factor (SCO1/SenC/PrrC family)
MDYKILASILVILLGGSIIGLSGAYLFYSPQLKDARIEIDYLSKKLELEATDEQTTASTGQDKAPDFTLIDLDGNIFTLSDKTGQIVLLDFMATWCGPCQAAMPDLVKLYEEFGDKVVMISISVDPSFDTDEVLSGWRDQWGASWIHARDLADPPAGQLYWVRAIPTYVIIDQFGNIQYRHIGSISLSVLRSELSALIEA